MTAEDVIRAVESGDLSALRAASGQEGLGQAFFSRIAELLGTDPSGAIRLGRHWRVLLRHADRKDYVLRGRGGALRAEGKWAESGRAFLAAGEAAEDPVERCTFALGAIDSLARAGLGDEAIRTGKRLADRLQPLDPAAAARAQLNLANAFVWQDRYPEAARAYGIALEHLEAPFEQAAALLGRSTAALFGGKLADVERDALAARERFNDLDLPVFAAQAEVNLAQVAVLRGRPDDAWDILRSLGENLDSLPDRARIQEFLGDVYLALNLNEDSLQAYRQAEALARAMPLNRANDWLGIGRSCAILGRAEEASNAFSRAGRLYLRVGNLVWERVARLERAKLAGRTRDLNALGDQFERLKASYWAAVAWLSAADLGDLSNFDRAQTLVRRRGYLSLRWKVDWITARQSGRLSDYRRMAEGILLDRLATRSVAARMGFLRDKGQAFREFLTLLLDRGTPASLAEAVDWVARTRSAALIDEIVSTPEFTPIREALESLRANFLNSEGGPGGVRLASRAAHGARALSALAHFSKRSPRSSATPDATVWIDLGPRFARIGKQKSEHVSASCIKRNLRWLEFEMMAPMTDRAVGDEACRELLSELRSQIGDVRGTVCPDGALWQVPWPLLSDDEPVVALGPQFGSGGDLVLPVDAKVCIWAHASADLPSVAREVEALMARFPQAELCTSAEAARSSLDQPYDYLHVATHARTNAANPMFSHFEFADGPLFAIEIARSRLRVRLAVLAACDTAKFNLTFPDEPDGLARAFLARGAEAVVAGMWPLDDEAAYVTIASLADSLSAGVPLREGLGLARAQCRRSFAHPYFWGPLVLLAGYRHG